MDWKTYWNNDARVSSPDPYRQVGRTFRQRSYSQADMAVLEQRVVHLLEAGGRKRLLDLGCGNGLLTSRLSNHFEQITAVDFSAPLLETARRDFQRPNIDYILADVLEYSYPDEAFDCVLLHGAFQYFSAAQAARLFASVTATLRPTGRFMLGDVADRDRIWSFYRGAAGRLRYTFDLLRDRPIIGHWWTPIDLETVARTCGLEAEIHYQPEDCPNHYFRFDAILVNARNG